MVTQKLLDEFREHYAAGKINSENIDWWGRKFKKIPFKLFKKIMEEEHEKKKN